MLSFKALADLNCVWEENNNPQNQSFIPRPQEEANVCSSLVVWQVWMPRHSPSHKQDLHDFSPQSKITTSFTNTPKSDPHPPPQKKSKINHKNSYKGNVHLKALFSSAMCRQIHSSSDNFINMIYSSDYIEHLQLNKK